MREGRSRRKSGGVLVQQTNGRDSVFGTVQYFIDVKPDDHYADVMCYEVTSILHTTHLKLGSSKASLEIIKTRDIQKQLMTNSI